METDGMGYQLNGDMPERRALRVREAIAAYRISKTKLYELMKTGRLATVKVGGSRLIPVDALEALLAPPTAPNS
jgi:excisionase family DNA binding protein